MEYFTQKEYFPHGGGGKGAIFPAVPVLEALFQYPDATATQIYIYLIAISERRIKVFDSSLQMP